MISRALILDKDKVLLIHRFRKGKEYFVLPGGHIEKNESEQQALLREVKEETNLDAQIDKRLWILKNPFDDSVNYFFLVTKFSGDLRLGGPESEKDSEEDRYILEWHKLNEIAGLNLVPALLKKKIISNFLNTRS